MKKWSFKTFSKKDLLIAGLLLIFCQNSYSINLAEDQRGVYALCKGGYPIPEKILQHSDLAGVTIRDKWRHLEPVEDQYDWSYFDTQFDRISQHDKDISLILTYGGMAMPDWILTKNIQFFDFTNNNSYSPAYGEEIRIPLFWDDRALAYKKKLIFALGQRYANYPKLKMVTAQCANALTGDWNMPKTQEDITQWRDLGYSADKLIYACQEIIDYTMQAFPNQVVKMAVGPVSAKLGDKPYKVARAVIDYAHKHYPGRFMAQRNNLSVNTPDPRVETKLRSWQVIWDKRPAVGAQMLWNAADTDNCRLNGRQKPCDSATMLQQAIAVGLAYDLRFLEVYVQDLIKPYGQQIIQDTAQILENN